MKKNKIGVNKIDIVIFLMVVLIYIGSLLAFYPGLMTSDNLDQINQAITGIYSDSHPILHSFIIGSIYKIFGTISVVALFQIIVFSVIWTYTCKALRKDNESRLINVLQILLTVVICLIPINFLYSITLWKDILYSYAMLGVVLYIYIGIKSKFNYSILQMILTSLFLALIMRLRHNGLPVGLIVFIILLMENIVRNKNIKKSICFITCFISIFAICSIPKWTFKNKRQVSASGTFTATKIYCMGTILQQEPALDEDERYILDNILSIESWKNGYNEYSGGGIFYNSEFNSHYLDEHLEEFNSIFSKYAKKYPKQIIKHFVNVNSIFWSIKEKGYLHSIVSNNEGMEEHLLWKEEYTTRPKSNISNIMYNKIINITMNNKILYSTLYRPATLMYLSIIIVFIVIIKTKKWDYLLLSFPMLLNIGTYLPFISSQDLRYAYPNFMTCYFLINLIITILSKKKINKKNKSPENKNEKKTLVIIPSYNEEKSIKKVIAGIYSKTDNCDVVVVNDGSKDNTLIEAKKTNAKVIDLSNNLGIGGAVQTGYLYAYKNNYDIAIQVDADGQHDPKYIMQMIDILKDGQVDMVIGSRFVEKTRYEQTFFRMFGIRITSIIIQLLTDKKIYDTTSGFRAVNKGIIEEFAKNYPYDYPEPCTNMEMILKGKEIKEIPVEMKQRETGISSISPLKSVKYMVKVVLSLLIMRIKKY